MALPSPGVMTWAVPGVSDAVPEADGRLGKDSRTPAARPPEFRRRAVELAWRRDKPIAQVARYLGISESTLRWRTDQPDVDEGHKSGPTGDGRAEVSRLRRENSVQAMAIENREARLC